MANRQQELKKRWDDFLTKMKSRFKFSLTDGETATLQSLLDNNYDYYISFRAIYARCFRIQSSPSRGKRL